MTQNKPVSDMNDWYTLDLGDALLAESALDRIRDLFTSAQEQAKQPDDMAIFVRHESEGQLHCAVKLYFSPDAAAIARELGAVPCAKPAQTDLGLFAGGEHAWSVWFTS